MTLMTPIFGFPQKIGHENITKYFVLKSFIGQHF